MCGIVGYVGRKSCVDILLNGLTKLEYRGYDSGGIAVDVNNKIEVYKEAGKLQNLKNAVAPHHEHLANATMGIGHIRWATHGAPTALNAHPHVSEDGRLALVHNGIIENFKELRKELENEGYHFVSQTDTEVFAFVIEREYKKVHNLTEAVRLASRLVQGA